MRKSFVATMLAFGACATLATGAYAAINFDDAATFTDGVAKARPLAEASRASKLRGQADGDTTFVGYNPAFASASNPWQIGVGAYRPFAGSNNARRGYWDWDTPIGGDSLQGWWPMRHIYSSGTSMPTNDKLRPWYALETGNLANYVMTQGTGHKRTPGVVGVWHADPGSVVTSSQAGTNPHSPSLAVSGTRAAWCGLRGHGDRTVFDGVTGNPITVESTMIQGGAENGTGPNGTGTNRHFPGYMNQMDQFLYRDINTTGIGSNDLTIRFKARTRMSTQFGTTANTRVGWCAYDPSSTVSPNFISSNDAGVEAPRDSFMVYVGKPVEVVGGTNNDYINANGQSRDIYDPLRRWFTEIIRFDGTWREIYANAGNVDAGLGSGSAITCGTTNAVATTIGTTVRLVFRVHTNRGFDDESFNSLTSYTSGYGGAAIVDDVEYNIGAGFVSLGTFEAGDGAGQNIDNSVGADVSWRSTGKPPAIYPHVRDVNDVGYTDLCGLPGDPKRACNMYGIVLSMGEYPNENKAGDPGTVDRERWDSIISPTIITATAGPATPNGMGLTGDMVNATEDWYIVYDLNTAATNATLEGIFIQEGFMSYPATQDDGAKDWSAFFRPPFISNEDNDLCNTYISFGAYQWGLIWTTNSSNIPDSVRCVLRKLSYCYRFSAPNCGDASKAYAYDNVTFTLIDGAGAAPISTNFWQFFQDGFPANEDSSLPGTAAFDTCAAWIQIGLNTSIRTTDEFRHTVAGDTATVSCAEGNQRVDLVFRILPGPGNYATPGDPTSGLLKRPDKPGFGLIAAGDSSFWGSYISDNGTYGSAGGHPAGTFSQRWSNLVWNSARCDTADYVAAPVEAKQFGITAIGSNFYSSMYHESELAGSRAKLAILRNICFMQDTNGVTQAPNINCGRPTEGFGSYPPGWVATVPASRTGYPKTTAPWPLTAEGTKIFPDGLFTPGTHIQYFYRRLNTTTSAIDYMPDSNLVLNTGAAGDTDGFRWHHFSVLPDAWKKGAYGGLGEACMLYVDNADGRGNERIWTSLADSLGGTDASKFGAHNGWHASGQQVLDADVDNVATFVRNKNAQPGTTWDLYGVKAGEAGGDIAGSIGSRESNREPAGLGKLEYGMDARNAPTQTMLDQYSMVLVTTAGLQSELWGPFSNHSADDFKVLSTFLLNGNNIDVRGMLLMGDGIVQYMEEEYGDVTLEPLLGCFLVANNYLQHGGNPNLTCQDLTPTTDITSNGDVYGVVTNCQVTLDDLGAAAGGTVVTTYPPIGLEEAAGAVVHKVNGPATEYWLSMISGFKISDVRSRFCGSSYGRLAYFYNTLRMFEAAIGGTCNIVGEPLVTLDTPNTPNGQVFVDFMSLKNNPLTQGNATISFGLSKADRVTIKVYDVSGRLVRTLVDGRLYEAGNDHKVTWDGVDNFGRMVPRGVYFSAFETSSGRRFERKMTVLK